MARPRGRIATVRRAVRFKFLIPIFRSPHPPEYTARGVAAGVFWACIPVLGLQTFFLLGTWALAKRAGRELSLVQALAWQWVNNPITMLPMFYLFYETGEIIGGRGFTGYDAFVDRWYAAMAGATGWYQTVVVTAEVLGVPTLLGSVPWAIAGAWAGYAWSLSLVRRRRARVARRAPAEPPA